MILQKNENTTPNIWVAQERVIHLHRMGILALAMIIAALGMILVYQSLQSPIVVVRGEAQQEFYSSVREAAPVGKPEVVAFAKSYLASLYVWDHFDVGQITRAVTSMSDPQLVPKISAGQTQRYLKELKGKTLAEAITFVDVQILPDRVVCRFDRVLKIEGIPLVIPTEVTLSLIQGTPTKFNPMGIYVAGIQENDSVR